MVIEIIWIALVVVAASTAAWLTATYCAKRGYRVDGSLSSAEVRLLQEHAGYFLYRLNPEGKPTYLSPSVEAVTGYPVKTLCSEFTRHLTDNPINDIARRCREEALATGEQQPSYRIEMNHRDGWVMVLEVVERPYKRNGSFAGLFGFVRDVTESHQYLQEIANATREWNLAMDFVPNPLYIVDLQGKVMRANRAFLTMLGKERGDVVGADIYDLIHPDGGEHACLACRPQMVFENSDEIMEAEHPDNPAGYAVEMKARVIPGADGRAEGIIVGLYDLTQQRETQEELQLAASVFEWAHEGIVISDAEGRVVRTNFAFTVITGYSSTEAQGQVLTQLLSAGEGEEKGREEMDQVLSRAGHWQGEAHYRNSEGEVFPVWHRVSSQYDGAGVVRHYIHLLTDITDRKLSEERMYHLAHYDALTDLPNRVLFTDRLHHAVERARRSENSLALLFIDLDHFKSINDTMGHQAGDKLLQGIAQRLRAAVREEDTVARISGDEFVVLLEQLVSEADIPQIADKILTAVSTAQTINNETVAVGCSIGISIYPDDGEEPEALIKHADGAMYRSKQSGRNTFRFHNRERSKRSTEEHDLGVALSAGELSLHYLPQFEVKGERISGSEALLRWNHPQQGVLNAADFMQQAEHNGCIDHIGEWVLQECCRQANLWVDRGVRLSMNLSPSELLRENLPAQIEAALEHAAFEPSKLELELPERFLLRYPKRSEELCGELKQMGLSLAVDDFGTGSSAPIQLHRLPIDRIKIDRSWIDGIERNSERERYVSSVITMAHGMGISVCAVGVEQEQQLELLRSHDCDEFQGYLRGGALDAEGFTKHLPL